MKITVYRKDNKVADITVTDNKIEHIKCMDTGIITPFKAGNESRITIAIINDFLLSRCFDKNRPDKEELLAELGIDNYNPVLIIKKTKGIMAHDDIRVIIDE